MRTFSVFRLSVRAHRAIAPIALAGLTLAHAHPSIGLNTMSLRARVHSGSQRITARLTTDVRTPIGTIGVTGTVDASFACDGTIDGTVEYPRVVRALAAIKRVTLVRHVSGTAEARPDDPPTWMCTLASDSLRGAFTVTDTTLTGDVAARDSVWSVAGVVAPRNGKAYDVRVWTGGGAAPRQFSLHLR